MANSEIPILPRLARSHSRTRATGPRTDKGKSRSSLNAVRHGLSAVHLVLPGEDAVEYEARLDGVFATLAPTNEAEAQLVALIGDDLWKLERLGRIEQALTLGRIEELLPQTFAGEKASAFAEAFAAFGRAVDLFLAEPLPNDREGLAPRLRTMYEAVRGLATVPETRAAVAVLESPLQALSSIGPYDAVSSPYTAAAEAAKLAMHLVLEVGDGIEQKLEQARKMGAAVALPDVSDLKLVSKYRAILEQGLHRRLAALEALRKLAAERARTEATEIAAHDFRVRLRVVR